MKFSTANTFYILFLLQATSILNVHAVAVTDNHDESIVVQPTTTTTETATTVRNNRSLRGSGEGATTLKTNQRRSLSATGSCVLPIYAGIKNYCFLDLTQLQCSIQNNGKGGTWTQYGTCPAPHTRERELSSTTRELTVYGSCQYNDPGNGGVGCENHVTEYSCKCYIPNSTWTANGVC